MDSQVVETKPTISTSSLSSSNIKVCRVCGDRAFSFHFNAITCSPCKMFFKRNAFKTEILKCLLSTKEGRCPINCRTTRKSCPKCRLMKCYAIGMTTENLVQKPSSQLTPKEHRKRSSQSELSDADSEIKYEDDGDDHQCNSSKRISLSNVNSLLHEEISRRCHQLEELEKAEEVEEEEETKEDQTKQYPRARRSKQKPTATRLLPKKDATLLYRIAASFATLTTSEARLLAEATAASASCFVDESQLPVVGQIGSLVEAFNAYSHYVRRIVGYCNRVEAFKAMRRPDQLALLKPFYFELLAIRFSFLYSAETDGYPVIENEAGTKAVLMRIGLINDSRRLSRVTEIHRKYKSSLHDQMEGDPTIRDLIMIQFLFRNSSFYNTSASENAISSVSLSNSASNSSSSNISCLEFVRKQYFLYCHLLRRYLEVKYGSISVAAKKYASLMSLLEDFSRYHYVREIFDSIEDTSAVSSDVLSEIFNR